jgi:hypothetical protein
VKANEESDWAILKLDSPVYGVRPLRRAESYRRGDRWLAYGFPTTTGEEGLVIGGRIEDPDARDPLGTPALQLYSDYAAAGRGGKLQGLSGAPVLVGGAVVGHLKRVIPDADAAEAGAERAELGVLFACHIGDVGRALRGILGGAASDPVTDEEVLPPHPGEPFDPFWHVHREREERTILAMLTHRQPIVLKGPEWFGKTHTLECLLQERAWQQEGMSRKKSKVVRLNMDEFSEASKRSLDTFLHEIACRVVTELGGFPDCIAAAWARPNDASGKMSWLVENHVLALVEKQLILAVTRLEGVCGYDFTDDFFRLLRAWAEKPNQEPWSRLRLVLEVSVTPTMLTTNKSTLNVFFPVPLDDLDSSQVYELAKLHRLEWDQREIRKLIDLVGGHPYLVRKAMFETSRQNRSLKAVLRNSHTNRGIFSDFLRVLWRRLEASGPDLVDAVRQVLVNPGCRLDVETYELLYSVGLIVQENCGYRLRYKLYEQYIVKNQLVGGLPQ